MELTAEDRALLEFERGWWTEPGLKTERIRAELGMTSSRYYRRLAELLHSPDAMAFDPLLVRRLRKRRLHDEALGTRASGRPQR